MPKASTTDDITTRYQNARDPLSLLHDALSDLILTALVETSGLSPPDLASLYLARSELVSGEKLGSRYSMRFDLRVKAAEHAKDVSHLSLEFVVKPAKVIESC